MKNGGSFHCKTFTKEGSRWRSLTLLPSHVPSFFRDFTTALAWPDDPKSPLVQSILKIAMLAGIDGLMGLDSPVDCWNSWD